MSSRTEALALRARRVTELEVDDFARLIGVRPEVVGAWERGERAPPPIGARLLELIVARPDVALTLARLAGAGDPCARRRATAAPRRR